MFSTCTLDVPADVIFPQSLGDHKPLSNSTNSQDFLTAALQFFLCERVSATLSYPASSLVLSFIFGCLYCNPFQSKQRFLLVMRQVNSGALIYDHFVYNLWGYPRTLQGTTVLTGYNISSALAICNYKNIRTFAFYNTVF